MARCILQFVTQETDHAATPPTLNIYSAPDRRDFVLRRLEVPIAIRDVSDDALAVLEQFGGSVVVSGEAYLLTGCVEEAHRLTQEVLTDASRFKERGHEARALRLLGEIAMRDDPPDVALAEAYYQQALALAE